MVGGSGSQTKVTTVTGTSVPKVWLRVEDVNQVGWIKLWIKH
jgi:hypothetical protein